MTVLLMVHMKITAVCKKSVLTISVYRSEENKGPGNARNIGMNMAKESGLLL